MKKASSNLFTEKEVERILYNVQQFGYLVEKWNKENRLGD